jgi:hypothetical protein
MKWNHRVVFIKAGDETISEDMLTLAEVYYSDEGKPHSYSEPFVISETLDGIKELVTRFEEATKQPVLAYPEDFDLSEVEVEDEDTE